MLYDKKNAGFTKCPTETKPVQRFYQPKIYDESMADQMLHYMRLNRCGRKQIRSEGTTKEKFIEVL